MVMVEPPRKGLFVFTARLNANSGSIRVVAIRTQGEIDVGTTLWLLTTFLMRPEAPAPTPAPTTPSSGGEKAPSVKPTPEKSTPEKSPEQGKEQQGDDASKSKDKKSDESTTR
jgi:hypothetical protein